MKNLKHLFQKMHVALGLLILSAVNINAQIPQNIDPGQEVDPVSLWEKPQYIVPIAVIVIALVGYSLWRRSKRH